MGAFPEGWASVERWLSRLAPSTARVHLSYFKGWMKWVNEGNSKFSNATPDELISIQKNVENGTLYDVLDEIVQPYVMRKEGTFNTKNKIYAVIRSYFKHNRAQLPRDPTFIIRPEREKNEGTLTIEEIRKVVLSSNPMYQAVFLSMFQGGMDRESFEYWNKNGWPSLREQLILKSRVVRIDLPGRKKFKRKRTFYTYIGKDAIDAIQVYLEELLPTERGAIFLDKFNKPLSKKAVYQYWLRHLRKIGIVGPSKGIVQSYQTGKNPHELRDVFRSQWEKSSAKISVAEYMMGHIVDPLEYNKAHRDKAWTRREFLKAENMLNIMSSDRPYGKIDESEIETLRRRIEQLDMRNEDLQMKLENEMNVFGRGINLEEIRSEIQEFMMLRKMEREGASYEEMEAALDKKKKLIY